VHGYVLAVSVLLVFSGLLRPLQSRAWALPWQPDPRPASRELPPEVSPDRALALPIRLNAIELALLAELSLEQARAHEAVANDPRKRHETRVAASEAARAWRERAGLFQSQAGYRSGHPMGPGHHPLLAPASSYTGAERRKQMRRQQTRRVGHGPPSPAIDRRDRRVGAERRRSDRRRPRPAPR
jgi:hypothetical protein